MGQLIFAYCVGAFFALLPLLGKGRMERLVETADEEHLRSLRQFTESRWTDYLLGAWGFLAAVAATLAVVRGHPIGWAWFGVSALYVFGIYTGRQRRAHLLAVLGDRGRQERPERYKRRAAISYRFVAVGVTGYIGTHVMEYAYPHSPPDWSEAVRGVFALIMIVGAIGFFAVRARMYWSGDDLEQVVDKEPDPR
jgi:hypothetical protein